MSQPTFTITKGKAAIVDGGLRCQEPRPDNPRKRCNKQLARVNSRGQLAGNYRCDRCKKDVEVEISFE